MKFKAGDKIRRIIIGFRDIEVGDIVEVARDQLYDSVALVGHQGTYAPDKFELVQKENPLPPIGTTAVRFTDSNGDKMVMISVPEDVAEFLRALTGARVSRDPQPGTGNLYKALTKIYPLMADYKLRDDLGNASWGFAEYKPRYTNKGEQDEVL